MLWSFGDTFISQVAADGAIVASESPGMVSNTFLVQSGACFTPMIGGAPGSPRAVFTPKDPTSIFWPLDGYLDPVRNQVVVDSLEVTRGTFTIVAINELYFSWPDLTPQGSAAAPLSGRARPNPVRRDHARRRWSGVPLLTPRRRLVRRPRAARSCSRRTVGVLERRWLVGHRRRRASHGLHGTATLAPLDVVRYQGRYLGVAKIWDVASDDVSQWTSDSPTGPWTYSGRLATTPTGAGTMSYGGRIVMLPENQPVVIYSVNNWSFDTLKRNVLLYGVRVVPYVEPVGTSTARGSPSKMAPPSPGGPVVVAGHSSPVPRATGSRRYARPVTPPGEVPMPEFAEVVDGFQMPLAEAMRTQRAVRRLTARPGRRRDRPRAAPPRREGPDRQQRARAGSSSSCGTPT